VKLVLLALLPVVYCAFFGMRAWHGGLSLNLRYFLPVLPGAAILVASSVARLWQLSRPAGSLARVSCWLVPAVLAVVVFEWQVWQIDIPSRSLQRLLLDVPLVLACILLVTSLVAGKTMTLRAALMASAVAACALTWSTLIAFRYDYPLTQRQRTRSAAVAAELRNVIPDDGVVFVLAYESLSGLLDRSRVVLARASNDGGADAAKLARCFLSARRPVYLAAPRTAWDDLRRASGMVGIAAEEILSPNAGLSVQRLYLER
jgi:hypothetical protein